MKKIIALLICTFFFSAVFARDVSVRGYTRSNGTYVQSHHRSAPDGIRSNNWSHYGNVNPYTGKVGTNRDGDYGYRYYGGYSSGGYIPQPQHNEKTSGQYSLD